MTDTTPLLAKQFKNDPRLQEAKSLIKKTLEEYQSKITGIRPPQIDLKITYEHIINTFMEYRGGKLYFPFIGSGIGKGALVELMDGSHKYDMISGIGVHYWGHHHLDLLDASLEASLNDTIMQGHLQQNYETIELSRLLIEASKLDHCFLCSSGAMANENALKIAFQHRFPASRILAFEKCFMGRTLAMAQITDKPAYREGLPPVLNVDYIPFFNPESPKESTELAVNTLKKHLARYPNQHAAMCFELVQGEGGFFPGSTIFFEILMKILKEHKITILVDEVQTFGRTCQLFAFQHFGLDKYVDIVTIGKLSQVCATLFRKEFKPKPGLLSQTFTSSSTAIHAGHFIIKSLLTQNFFGNEGKISQIHRQFVNHFERIEKKYPHLLKGPYGIGGMIAFTPFNGEFNEVTEFIQNLYQAGVISFIAGSHPSRVRFLVPMGAITTHGVDEVMAIVEKVLCQKGL